MSPMPAFLRRAGAFAALAALLAQAVLPPLHAWVVDASETAYHAGLHESAPRAELCADHDRGHHHHSDADCPLCPLFSSARLAAADSGFRTPVRGRASSFVGSVPLVGDRGHAPAAPVRGPPAVLSA